jgi:hypothetical protein
MRTAIFEQQRLVIDHHQQQISPSDLEGSPVAFIQINQTLKWHEHKCRPGKPKWLKQFNAS